MLAAVHYDKGLLDSADEHGSLLNSLLYIVHLDLLPIADDDPSALKLHRRQGVSCHLLARQAAPTAIVPSDILIKLMSLTLNSSPRMP